MTARIGGEPQAAARRGPLHVIIATVLAAMFVATASASAATTVSVPANQDPNGVLGPVQTGVVVTPTNPVTVSGSGTVDVCGGGCPNTGPDGLAATLTSPPYQIPSNLGALIGRVGNGPFFLIGSGPTLITGNGPLFLAVNDNSGPCPPGAYCDNTGSFTATISSICTQNRTGNVFTSTTVGAGQTACFTNASVFAPINVQAGGQLIVSGSTLSSPITSNGATGVTICGSRLNSTTNISTSTGPVLIGNIADGCAANTNAGTVNLTNNAGGVEVADNTLFGPVTITGTTGGTGEDVGATVEANTNSSVLSCTANTPISNDGRPNNGNRRGQCSNL